MPAGAQFLSGVIEGFYGQPWSRAERLELFDLMSSWGLNSYLYAPKDDLKHRALWREPYSSAETEALRELISASKQAGIRFIYALSPGLDIRYSESAELDRLKARFEQIIALGCEDFALLFDDLPDRMSAEDAARFKSFASAQAHLTNTVLRWTRERGAKGRFLFCPTPYCGRMAARQLGGENYLGIIGRELLTEIDIFWTGPEIVSKEITVAHMQELQELLRRKPLIWDNIHANDYDARRFFCGPYAGRPVALREEVSGILTNPNCEFVLNYLPIRTLGEFLRCGAEWEPRAAYLAAMQDWLNRFATAREQISFEDFVLFGDCYYLPHEEGAEAEKLLEIAKTLTTNTPEKWGELTAEFRKRAGRLREICVRLTELRERRLFYPLAHRIWELREELDLLERYVTLSSEANEPVAFTSDYHLPGTYRGGFIARLQRLLEQQPEGTFKPAAR